MTIRSSSLATLLVLTMGAGIAACGSDDNNGGGTGTGGAGGAKSGGSGGSSSGGSGGGSASTGGTSGGVTTGGNSGSTGGAGGGTGGGGGGAGGGSGGATGDAGDAIGSGGATGDAGGTEGGAAIGEFKLVVTGITARNGRNYFVRGQTNGTGNMSPGFEWGPHPEAKSYALTMIDMSNGGTHWVMWDIPTTVNKLPAALMRPANPDVPEVPGAKQTRFGGGGAYGYFGPGAGSCNQYHFIIHAMKVDKLTAMGDKNAMRAAVNNAANKLASTAPVIVIGNNSAGMCN